MGYRRDVSFVGVGALFMGVFDVWSAWVAVAFDRMISFWEYFLKMHGGRCFPRHLHPTRRKLVVVQCMLHDF